VFNIVQILISKCDKQENAKIAVLILMQHFSEGDLFKQQECAAFLEEHMPLLCSNMLFKIKKYLIPCLIAITKHIPYAQFIESVYSVFEQFCKDEIWGVRKVCVENLQKMITLLKVSEIERMHECLDFLQVCLSDSSKWVK